ncbi:MAG: glycogen synthase GlgA [Verrucomicrobia bacterium]|nr:glycogen synthase GlgA [Verrucomicrobiota bacterium]
MAKKRPSFSLKQPPAAEPPKASVPLPSLPVNAGETPGRAPSAEPSPPAPGVAPLKTDQPPAPAAAKSGSPAEPQPVRQVQSPAAAEPTELAPSAEPAVSAPAAPVPKETPVFGSSLAAVWPEPKPGPPPKPKSSTVETPPGASHSDLPKAAVSSMPQSAIDHPQFESLLTSAAAAPRLPAPESLTPASAPLPKPEPPDAQAVSEEKAVRDLPKLIDTEEKELEPPPVAAPPPPPPKPTIPPMFIVMITPEMAPVAKVGGLGDVVYGLSRELELRGNAVEIILPKYDCMRYDQISGLTRTYDNLEVPWYGGVISTSVWFGFVHGRKCFFIEPHARDNFFHRGVYYGQNDDVVRFAFFCRAALEFMWKTGKHPDIIHCHDWQTALVPVLLYEMYQRLGMRHPRVCFTVHNFRHQGVTGEHILRATGLHRPEYFFHYDRMRDNHNPHALNLMKAGIVFSNFVTTVSPCHAWEAKDAGQGHGLEPTLHTHQYKFGGVLNGVDYEVFNPETDPHIPAHYSAQTIEGKYENKRALRHRFWLADNERPIVAFIGRLDQQKGLELIRHSIFFSVNNRAQFVLLGNSPEPGTNDHFLGLKRHLNDNPHCHLEIAYNEELARLIYAGADMMVVPSRYEPCGLTQLISLRYGTVPVVRNVGGLADTVFDKDYSNRPLHERNGYVFDHADNPGLESALRRAIGCYYHFPDHFRHLMLNGLRCDYSWNHPGQHYLNIYDHIRDK